VKDTVNQSSNPKPAQLHKGDLKSSSIGRKVGNLSERRRAKQAVGVRKKLSESSLTNFTNSSQRNIGSYCVEKKCDNVKRDIGKINELQSDFW
jgi:hypothetical protein